MSAVFAPLPAFFFCSLEESTKAKKKGKVWSQNKLEASSGGRRRARRCLVKKWSPLPSGWVQSKRTTRQRSGPRPAAATRNGPKDSSPVWLWGWVLWPDPKKGWTVLGLSFWKHPSGLQEPNIRSPPHLASVPMKQRQRLPWSASCQGKASLVWVSWR